MLEFRRIIEMNLLKPFIEAKRKREKEKKIKAAQKLAVAATVGSAAGAVAGLLFAPKAGKETREDIAKNVGYASRSVKNSADNVKEKAVEIHKSLKGTWSNASKFFSELKEKRKGKKVVVQEVPDSDKE
jgi:gas vesicle protein